MKGDPYWVHARFASTCSTCGKKIKKDDRIFYWPKLKKPECEKCGLESDGRFESEVWDEEHNTCM